jgi:hypothetical protein
MIFQKVGQPQLCGGPNIRFQALTNDLAADLYSAIIIAVADVLQQMRHFRERAPFAIF